MDDPLDLVQLRSFLVIAECGGFRRAASALKISQPTVSQHVRLLEKRLGQALVTKSGRGVKFTDAGDRLLVEARRLLTAHDETLERLRVSAGLPVVVGSTEHAADLILPDLLGGLRSAFPDRRVKFRLDRSTRLLEDVESGRIDIAVIFGDSTGRPGVAVGELGLSWMKAPTLQIPSRPTDAWPLVVFDEPCGLRSRALHELAKIGCNAEIAVEATTLDGILTAARAGLGIAMLPVAARCPEGLEVVPELPELGVIDIKMVVRRGIDADIEAAACAMVSKLVLGRRARTSPIAADYLEARSVS